MKYCRIYCSDCKCVTLHYAEENYIGCSTMKCIRGRKHKGGEMFWNSSNSDLRNGVKPSISVSYDRNPDIGNDFDYPFCIDAKNGSGNLRLYLKVGQFEALVAQGNLLLQEHDRLNIERELGS